MSLFLLLTMRRSMQRNIGSNIEFIVFITSTDLTVNLDSMF